MSAEETESQLDMRLFGKANLPDGSLVTVRIGNKRRHGFLGEGEEALRFPAGLKNEKMKVDVYKPVGRARLLYDGSSPEFHVRLDKVLEDHKGFSLQSSAESEASEGQMILGFKMVDPIVGEHAAESPQADSMLAKVLSADKSERCQHIAESAQRYFDKHGITEALQVLVQGLITDEPDRPYEYMMRILENSVRAGKGEHHMKSEPPVTCALAPAAAPLAAALPALGVPLEPKRRLTVPAPDMAFDEEEEMLPQLHQRTTRRAPNPVLVNAMQGKTADWPRIRRMAESIREPSYSLRNFFDDCVLSFPELNLFFANAASKSMKFGKGGSLTPMQCSSGIAAEAEYQRTVAAMFAVYWMLRLEIDGRAGFCYGAHEDWSNITVGPPVTGLPFPKMSPDQKRADFYHSVDWNLLQAIVDRSGCGKNQEGSVERIMAMLCLTSFHDIMKIGLLRPVVQPSHAPYKGYDAGVRIQDHDVALAYVLDYFPELLPSYHGLDEGSKRSVNFTQGKMQFNHGWFVQSEGPPGLMLSHFKSVLVGKADESDIGLYFLHWFTDLCGAEATPLGGAEKFVLKFPRKILTGLVESIPYVAKLAVVTETELCEEYLEARWEALLPSTPIPTNSSSIPLMRLVAAAQAEDASLVLKAFRRLPAGDQNCLNAELARTGCEGQTFARSVVCGGPGFLLYYFPALMQKNNKSDDDMHKALQVLCVVLRGARALWPMSLKQQDGNVIVYLGELKVNPIDMVIENTGDSRSVWILLKNNSVEGTVTLCSARELNALHNDGSQFRILDFSLQQEKEVDAGVTSEKVNLEPIETRDTDFGSLEFKHGPRILVFSDMSTECDDECAFLWLLGALNRRGLPTTVELVHADSFVRIQWMAHILSDKFGTRGTWRLRDGGSAFLAGNVLVNMYLAHSPSNEERVITDLEKQAPNLNLATKLIDGKRVGVRLPGSLGGEDIDCVPGGVLDSIVVSAPIPDVKPEFFSRFSSCKCAYVVGTPGGVNCPMPSWTGLLAAMHQLCPVLYLTPDLTREIRFPRNYVASNLDWNDTIKQTIWATAVRFMAKRPEFPQHYGNWGLILRLNFGNAKLCADWHMDVFQKSIHDAEVPEDIVRMTNSYVDRYSGEDRQMGMVVAELRAIDPCVPIAKSDVDAKGQPVDNATKAKIRDLYREQLYKQVLTCVLTTDKLLWKHRKNSRTTTDEGGFEQVVPRCGYRNAFENLSEIFGADDAVTLIQDLPLRRLTPVYDITAMIFADCALEEGTSVDGGIGLVLAEADESMGLGMLSEEQRATSEHPILMTPPQAGDGVYAVGPFG